MNAMSGHINIPLDTYKLIFPSFLQSSWLIHIRYLILSANLIDTMVGITYIDDFIHQSVQISLMPLMQYENRVFFEIRLKG